MAHCGSFRRRFCCGLVRALENEKALRSANPREDVPATEIKARDASGVVGTLRSSRYLQTIAALIFVSVIVSTLIDYQFKAAAKEAYPSTDALAGFFGSYYAWLSAVTMFAQVWLTGRLLMGLGLTPSLLRSPLYALCGIDKPLGMAGPFYGDSDPTGRSVPAHECQSQRGGDSLSSDP